MLINSEKMVVYCIMKIGREGADSAELHATKRFY